MVKVTVIRLHPNCSGNKSSIAMEPVYINVRVRSGSVKPLVEGISARESGQVSKEGGSLEVPRLAIEERNS